MADSFYPGKGYPQPHHIDAGLLQYLIQTPDDKTWGLSIMENGCGPEDFPILKSHLEVFGWEETMGMLMLVSKDPIDPKVILEELGTDPVESVMIMDELFNKDVTKEFIRLYTPST